VGSARRAPPRPSAPVAPAGREGDVRDDEAMQRALALGEQARRRTPPNPWVGCVVVRGGAVVGEGACEPPGGPHAEIVALAAAGDRARGAAAVVTLEPCSHQGRTPPCADALIEAGVTRVVAALEDPDSKVAGTGLARLRDAGIEVTTGVGAHDATDALAPYLHHRRTGRAYCLAKTAASIDGRVAAPDGSSRWITGESARSDAHELRADSQAIVVGAGTALADEPRLTVRDIAQPPLQPPTRVLLDARGRVPAVGPLFDTDLAPTLVVTTHTADPRAVDAWTAAGAKVETVAPAAGGVDLGAVLELLGRDGALQTLVEGGPILHGGFLTAALVDRLVAYVAPVALGARARPMLGTWNAGSLSEAARFRLLDVRRIGADVRIDLEPER